MFRRIFRRRLHRQEIDEEFDAHLALASKVLQERGLSREEADREARRSFGTRTRLAEDAREAWVWGWFDQLSQDLRYGTRTLLPNPALSIRAILSIALRCRAGAGVSTT